MEGSQLLRRSSIPNIKIINCFRNRVIKLETSKIAFKRDYHSPRASKFHKSTCVQLEPAKTFADTTESKPTAIRIKPPRAHPIYHIYIYIHIHLYI